MVTVEDVLIPASALPAVDAGAPRVDVPARLYRPADAGSSTASTTPGRGVVWAHGGGFVHGDLDMPEADDVARACAAAGHTVLSVDYRLVTDEGAHRFPAAHDDFRAAFSWMAAHAARLGVDPTRLVLGGASAGGNLAAGVALRLARTTGVSRPHDLFLAYPVLHAPLPPLDDAAAALMSDVPEEGRFRPDRVESMNLHYVGDPEYLAHPYAYPGGHDLAGMPRTLIVSSEADDLRPSGEAFAAELVAAGSDATCTYEPGTTHGHLNRPDEPFAERTLTTFLTWLADSEQH